MTELLLRRRLVENFVHQIANEIAEPGAGDPFRWKLAALEALREAVEDFLTREFESKFMLTPYGLEH
jgi:histone H3/H4